LLGVGVPPKGSTSKKRASVNTSARTKDERRKMKKNESEQKRRGKEKEALDAIRKFLRRKATKPEILAMLVDEGEYP
jgi:hypothetical protein